MSIPQQLWESVTEVPPADLGRTLPAAMSCPHWISFSFTKNLLTYKEAVHFPGKRGDNFKEDQQWQTQQWAIKGRTGVFLGLNIGEVKGNFMP